MHKMVVPVIVMVLVGVIVLAVVVLGLSDWWELMFLAAIAAIMMGLYTGSI